MAPSTTGAGCLDLSKYSVPPPEGRRCGCRLHGATLVIAKLDRLSRDAHFLLGLQKAGVRFVAADMPEANEMVVGILAVVAQAERKMISERTKAGERWIWRKAEANSEALRAAGLLTETSMQTSMGHGPPPSVR